MISNLIENAIKYSPEGGTIKVALEPKRPPRAVCDHRLRARHPRRRAAADLREVLPPRSDMSRGIGGTGLGLYICRELVRRVDGRIWVESDGSSGSTFIVEIPQEAPAPAAAAHRRVSTAA